MNVIVYRLSLSNCVCTWETEAPGLGAAWGAEVAPFSPCPPGAWRGWTRPPAAGRPYPHLPRSCVRTQRSESHGRAVKMKSERLSWFYCWEGVEEAVNVHKLRPHKVAQEWASRQSQNTADAEQRLHSCHRSHVQCTPSETSGSTNTRFPWSPPLSVDSRGLALLSAHVLVPTNSLKELFGSLSSQRSPDSCWLTAAENSDDESTEGERRTEHWNWIEHFTHPRRGNPMFTLCCLLFNYTLKYGQNIYTHTHTHTHRN